MFCGEWLFGWLRNWNLCYYRIFLLEKVKYVLERCLEIFGKYFENSELNVVVVEVFLIKCIYFICKDKIDYLF